MMRGLASLLSQFAPLLLTALLAAASYWVALQSDRLGLGSDTEAAPTVPDYFVENFRLEEHHLVKRQHAVLMGTRAEHIPQNNVLNITLPIATRFEAQQVRLDGQAKVGVYHIDSDVLFLEQDVLVKRKGPKEQATVSAPALEARFNDNTVRTTEPSVIQTPGRTIRVKGFEMQTNTGDFKSLGKASVQIEAVAK